MRTIAFVTSLTLLVCLVGCGPGQSENQRPVARINIDSELVPVGEQVVLDGSESSDPDGDPLIHRWSLETPSGSSATLSRSRGEEVSFTPDVIGDYSVELVVDDGALESAPRAVVITATESNANQAPVADAGSDIRAEPGQEVMLDATGSSDPDGDTLTYAWAVDRMPDDSEAELSDPTDAQPSFTPDLPGTYVFEVTVTDPDGASDDDLVVVEVVQVNPNDPPVADAGDAQTVEVGTEATLDASGSSDPNGDTLSFEWTLDSAPQGSTAMVESAEQEIASLTPDVEGEYVVMLSVDDGEAIDTDTVTVTAEPALPCLIIGEMYEGASFNKAVEIFNCGDDTIDLADFGYCLVQNDNTTCNKQLAFDGQLAAGDVRLFCHPDLVWDSTQSDICDVRDTVVNFNGDDRMFIFEDSDGSGNYTTSDAVVDAFGQISDRPSSTPWADGDFRRCNFEQFDGTGAFDDTLYYERVDIGDMSDLGVAPTEGCP